MTWDTVAEREWWADRCSKELWWFAKRAHGIDTNPRGGWLIPRIHKKLCEWFQKHSLEWMEWRKRGIVRQQHLLVCIFREGGKTTLLTNSGSEWLQVRDPELGIAIGSENVDKAEKWFSPTPKILSGEDEFQKFTQYYGNWQTGGRMWSKNALVHAACRGVAGRDPSYSCFGVRTGLSGWRPDVIFLDDPISYEAIEDDSEWCSKVNSHCSSHLPVLKRNGMRVYIVTPYADDDLWTEQIKKHGVRSVTGMKIPGVEPSPDGMWHVFFMPGRDEDGIPTAPEIWPEPRMQAFERDNPKHFYAQVLCMPYNEKNALITREEIDRCFVDQKDVPANLRISLHFDLAFKDEERKGKGDDTVIARLGHARDGSGEVYFLGAWASNTVDVLDFRNKFLTTLQELDKVSQYPFAIVDEIMPGDRTGVWEMTLQGWCNSVNLPLPKLHLLHRQGKHKVSRILAAVGYWRQGKFKIVRGAQGTEKLVTQMLTIGRGRSKDDVADACADGYNPVVYQPQRKDAPAVNLPYDEVLKPVMSYAGVRDKYLRTRGGVYDDVIE